MVLSGPVEIVILDCGVRDLGISYPLNHRAGANDGRQGCY
jgi:hypothetical protein